jgi:2-(1,2-epoxy-1,2-dihydrophenyl)acetyl-CoA isomerase
MTADLGQRREVLRGVISRSDGGTLHLPAIARLVTQLEALDPRHVGAVALTGAGANFCTGGDIGDFGSALDPSERIADMAREFHLFVRALVRVPVPVVAVVRGWAAGAGLSVACLADVVIAADSARFRAAYSDIGLTPDGGLSSTLPRVVGLGHARSLLLAGQTWTAENAAAAGLVHELVPDSELDATAEAVLATLASASPALGQTRRLMWESADRSLSDQLDEETAHISSAAGSDASRRAVGQFMSRRNAERTRDR